MCACPPRTESALGVGTLGFQAVYSERVYKDPRRGADIQVAVRFRLAFIVLKKDGFLLAARSLDWSM